MNTKPEISSLEELQLFHISILAFVMGPQLFPAEHIDTLICIIQTTPTVLSARFYKSTTVATMVGGPKDFGGTKELEDLKAGRIQELGGPKC